MPVHYLKEVRINMNEFIKRDGKIILNVDHMDAYIPLDMFSSDESKSAIAAEYGEGFKILGIFNVRLFMTPDQSEKDAPLRTFNYPNMIETYPSSFTNRKLDLTGEEMPYKVLHYTQGDVVMPASMPKSANNCTKFLNTLTAGKLPNTMPYSDIIVAWHKNMDTNGITPPIPSMYMQAIVAEKCRSRKDPSLSFRKVYGKNMSSNEYIMTNMRGTAAYSSVFASQTFEHMGRMFGTSVNMTRRDIPQNVSPIEKTLYM
jgi:hypothetical protein